MSQPSSLSVEHVARLEEALRRHAVQLRKALTDAERDIADLHLPIAGQLRALLLDADVPILLTYAAYKNIDLRVWGPYPPGFRGVTGSVVFSFGALVASSQPVADSFEMSVREYLDTPFGATPIPEPNGDRPRQTLWYTPKQLIKWVANKEGVAHLDLNPPTGLRAIKDMVSVSGTVTVPDAGFLGATDAFIVRLAILQIGHWTLDAIDRVLTAPLPAGATTA